MKIIELILDDKDKEMGVYAVSVVEDPAIEENFIKLSKSRLDYLNQQATFATASVYSAYSGGTIRGPLSNEEIGALYRAASFQLSGLYENYRTFAEKPEGR